MQRETTVWTLGPFATPTGGGATSKALIFSTSATSRSTFLRTPLPALVAGANVAPVLLGLAWVVVMVVVAITEAGLVLFADGTAVGVQLCVDGGVDDGGADGLGRSTLT